MKNILKLFLAALFVAFSVQSMAQSKIGHINFDELVAQMPGQDSINKALENYVSVLESQSKSMQTELESKYADYQSSQATMSETIRQIKEKEIMDLQQRIEAFNQQAQYDIQNKQFELSQPLLNKAQKAIEAVAKENGFTYIINSNVQILLYANGTDIAPLVKAKLGL